MTDSELLQRFVAGDQGAMEQLVTRHVALVYAAAVRQVGRESAEDVAQGVFLILSSRARDIHGGRLVGWLLKATFYACQDVKKRERRRRFHEERAMAEHAKRAEDPTDPALWEEIRGVIDGALLELTDVDRAVVGLRVLEGRSWGDVGAIAGMTEDAARKRLSRALEKLRGLLSSRGIAVPAAGMLVGLLTHHGAEAAPAGLAAAVSSGGSAGAGIIAQATQRMLMMAKVKMVAMATAAIVAAGLVAGAVAAGRGVAAMPSAVASSTPSPPPVVAVGDVWRGILVDEVEKPVGGASYDVMVWTAEGYRKEGEGKTGADGRFELRTPTREKERSREFFFDVPGHAWAWWQPRADLFGREVEQRIVLETPMVVAGNVVDGAGHPIGGAEVELAVQNKYAPGGWTTRDFGINVRTDAEGKFRFERVPGTGKASLTVMGSGFVTYRTSDAFPDSPFAIAPGTKDLAVKMMPGGAVRVQLTRGGRPWEQAGVTVSAYSKERRTGSRAQTDAGGAVLLGGLPPGEVRVSAGGKTMADAGLVMGDVQVVPLAASGTADAVVELAVGRSISGWLVNEVTGKGMTGTVRVVSRPEGLVVGSTVAAADGTFSVLAPKGGDYALNYDGYTAEGGGQSKKFETAVGSQETVKGVTFRARPWPELRGRLVDAKGRPVAGRVVVQFWSADTDSDGRFSMRVPTVLEEGCIAVAFDWERKLGRGFVYHVGDEAKELVLTLEPMGVIEGRATLDGKGTGEGVGVETYILAGLGGLGPQQWVWDKTVAADGKFRIAPVPVGCVVDLHLIRPGVLGDSGKIQLAAGETRDVGEVALLGAEGSPVKGTGTVEGSVVDEDGKPVVGAHISVLMVQGRSTADFPETDIKGHFVVKGLPDGQDVMLATDSEAHQSASWRGVAGAKDVVLKLEPQGKDLWGKEPPALAVSGWINEGFTSWADMKGKVVILQTGQDYRTYAGQPQDARELYKKYHAQGLEVVTIQTWRSNVTREQVSAWAREQGIVWPVGLEEGQEIEQGVPAIGTMYRLFGGQGNYVIDRKGVLRASVRADKLEEWVKKLLAE